MNWNSIVLIISFLLAAFMVWKEYKRAVRIHLALRIAASLIAAAALACIILPVSYSGESILSGNNEAVLLTPGFRADSMARYPNSRIFTADQAIAKTYPKAKLIAISELKTDSPAIARLQVLGYGLNRDELQQLNNIPVSFHSARSSGGITNISWNGRLKEGGALRIQGNYSNSTGQPVKLVLKGLNTDLDTTSIPAGSNKNFELNASPKQTGRAVYNLLAVAGNDTLSNDDLPFEITPVKPLKILVLTASPDFETRFLKNWLTGNGFGIVIRSAISKDKFVKEYINISALPLNHLTNDVLNKFDLVVGDLSVLKSLHPDEEAVLKQQVSGSGLGLIIQADSSSKNISWLQSNFPVDNVSVKEQVVTSFNILYKKGLTARLKTDPNYIRPENGTQPLVTDEKQHIMASSVQYGSGRLIFSTLSNTFNWELNGNKNDYEAFWSTLISKAARKEPVAAQWFVNTAVPQINTPVKLQLETVAPPAAIFSGRSAIAPVQDATLPFQWYNTYWPSLPGWQQVKQGNGIAAWWYAYQSGAWKSISVENTLNETKLYAANTSGQNTVTNPLHQKVRIEVSKLYFYVLLLAALSYLWISPTQPSPEGEG